MTNVVVPFRSNDANDTIDPLEIFIYRLMEMMPAPGLERMVTKSLSGDVVIDQPELFAYAKRLAKKLRL